MKHKRNRVLSIMIIIIISLTIICLFNKTCFKSRYTKIIKNYDIEIKVPFLSYYTGETKKENVYEVNMTAIRELVVVKEEIEQYLAELDKLDCQKGLYYDKVSDITIHDYTISHEGIWFTKTITIRYSLGQFCFDNVDDAS